MVTYERLYDASDATKINAGSPTDGDPVSLWTNSGTDGAAWDVAEGTAGMQPTWQNAVQNGLAVVEFDGGDRLVRVGADADRVSQPTFLAVVCRFTGDTGSSARFVVHNGTDSAARHILWVENGQWELFVGGQRFAGSAVTNDPVVVTAVVDGANSLLRVDGVEATGTVDGSMAQEGIEIGALNGGTPWVGWIGQLGFAAGRPTSQEILDEEDALTAKWMGGGGPETRETTAHAAPASASVDRTGAGERDATAHTGPVSATAARDGTATRQAAAHTGVATAAADRTGTGAREATAHTGPVVASADRTGTGQRETTAHTGTVWAAAEAESLGVSVRTATAHTRPAHATADRTGTGTRRATAWADAVTATAARTATATRDATVWAAPAVASAARTGTAVRTATAHTGPAGAAASRVGSGTRTTTAWTDIVVASALSLDLSTLPVPPFAAAFGAAGGTLRFGSIDGTVGFGASAARVGFGDEKG